MQVIRIVPQALLLIDTALVPRIHRKLHVLRNAPRAGAALDMGYDDEWNRGVEYIDAVHSGYLWNQESALVDGWISV